MIEMTGEIIDATFEHTAFSFTTKATLEPRDSTSMDDIRGSADLPGGLFILPRTSLTLCWGSGVESQQALVFVHGLDRVQTHEGLIWRMRFRSGGREEFGPSPLRKAYAAMAATDLRITAERRTAALAVGEIKRGDQFFWEKPGDGTICQVEVRLFVSLYPGDPERQVRFFVMEGVEGSRRRYTRSQKESDFRRCIRLFDEKTCTLVGPEPAADTGPRGFPGPCSSCCFVGRLGEHDIYYCRWSGPTGGEERSLPVHSDQRIMFVGGSCRFWIRDATDVAAREAREMCIKAGWLPAGGALRTFATVAEGEATLHDSAAPQEAAACTCPIETIMTAGCRCGAMETERGA